MASEPQAEDLAAEPPVATAAQSRAETVKRLQVGLSGIAAMVLLVSLAGIIRDQLRESEAGAVGDDPAATAQTEPQPGTASDPLADAGVVPDIPATPTPAPTDGNAPAAQP